MKKKKGERVCAVYGKFTEGGIQRFLAMFQAEILSKNFSCRKEIKLTSTEIEVGFNGSAGLFMAVLPSVLFSCVVVSSFPE